MKREMLIAFMLIMTIGAAGCSAKDENEPVISGTWQTASIGYEVDGEMQPEYYVKFSDSEIIYGHMEKNDFVPDHIDSISNFEKLSEGGYKVQAESESGVQYTYRSAEGDVNILEYYATWDEKDFSEKYSGSSSLSRCE